jgi:hypothetical protein
MRINYEFKPKFLTQFPVKEKRFEIIFENGKICLSRNEKREKLEIKESFGLNAEIPSHDEQPIIRIS